MRHLIATITLVASLATAAPLIAQESEDAPTETTGDTFAEAVDEYVERELDRRRRSNTAREVLERLGNEKLKDLAKRLGISKFRPENPYVAALRMALESKPLNSGEQELLASRLKDYWPYPKPTRKPQVEGQAETSAAVAPSAPALSRAARYLIDAAIAEACDTRGGTMDPRGYHIRDLDGDGRDDLLLDRSGITCTTGGNMSCGVQVCETDFFLRRGNLLKKELELLGTVTSVSSDPIPIITFYAHGGGTPSWRWNGRSFVQR